MKYQMGDKMQKPTYVRGVELAAVCLIVTGLIVLGIALYKASEKPIPVINRIMCANSGVCK